MSESTNFNPSLWRSRIVAAMKMPGVIIGGLVTEPCATRYFAFAIKDVEAAQGDPSVMDEALRRVDAVVRLTLAEAVESSPTGYILVGVDMPTIQSAPDGSMAACCTYGFVPAKDPSKITYADLQPARNEDGSVDPGAVRMCSLRADGL